MSMPAPIPHTAVEVRLPETPGELVARRAALKADAEYITGQIDLIDGRLIELLGSVGTHDVDGVKVQIREYSRVNYGALAKAFTPVEYPQLYVQKVELDQEAVKVQFAPAALDKFKVIGKRSVVIS